MVLTAEGSLLGRVTDLDHEINQILNREDSVVKHRVLRVDGLDEGPKLSDELYTVSVHPEVAHEHQIEEKLFAQSRVIYQESQLSKKLDSLDVDWNHFGVRHGKGAHDLQ